MRKKLCAGLLLAILLLSFCACKETGKENTTTMAPQDTKSPLSTDVLNLTTAKPLQTFEPTATGGIVSSTPNPQPPAQNMSLKQSALDYTYAWWPEGFAGDLRDFYIRTGHYGLSLNTERGYINHLGAFFETVDQDAAQRQGNEAIASLPELKMDYTVKVNGQEHPFARMEAMYETRGHAIYNRMAESGRYMQHMDLMYMKFKGLDNISGHLEVYCLPEYFGMSFGLYPPERVDNVVLTYSMTFLQDFASVTWNSSKTAVTVAYADGSGYTFVSADQRTQLDVSGRSVSFTSNKMTLVKNAFTGCQVTVIPSKNAQITDADKVLALISDVTVSAVHILPDKGSQPVTLDKNNGYFSIYQRDAKGLPGVDLVGDSLNDDYNNTRITITNNGSQPVRVPLQFYRLGLHSAAPIIRDSETGVPLGLAVQASVNFHAHENLPPESPRNYLTGQWQRYYTIVEVPANSTLRFDYTTTLARWGGLPVAVHQQISLIGWGGYQQWEHAIGYWGMPGICYDIERAWNGANMADAYPLYVAAYDESTNSYNFSFMNVGGGDFLFYVDKKGVRYGLKNMRTQYRQNGPNLAETIYTGYSADGKVKVEIAVYLSRDNCAARFIQYFKYTFLEDVTFGRMALYQNAADSYTYSWWKKMAVGNKDGLVNFKIGNQEFSGEFDVPYKGYNTYIGGSTMNQLQIGEGLWGAFLDPPKNQSMCTKVMAVHQFRGLINGKEYNAPTLSIRSTNINGDSCIYELNPPKEAGDTIRAGSEIECTVGYILLPVAKQEYYGDSAVMKSLPDEIFNTWEMAYLFATQSSTKVEASVGRVVRNYPAAVAAQGESGVVAQFTVSGGIGYVPISIKNLPSAGNWKLQKKIGDQWADIDQSIHGDDYWQCYYDVITNTYELTFNVEHTGRNDLCEYRLIRI